MLAIPRTGLNGIGAEEDQVAEDDSSCMDVGPNCASEHGHLSLIYQLYMHAIAITARLNFADPCSTLLAL